jgi:hypothetical protein
MENKMKQTERRRRLLPARLEARGEGLQENGRAKSKGMTTVMMRKKMSSHGRSQSHPWRRSDSG